MTIINPNSIAGITSLTAEADVMNFYKSNGTLGSLQLNGCNFNTTNGISTFNNLVVGGTLTYEDVKNVDSVGIITARGGLNVTANTDTDTLNVSGVSTFVGNAQFSTLSGSGVLVFSTGSGVLDDNVNHSISGSTLNTVDIVAQGNITVADKIIHRSDTNTSIRFPSNDTVSVETGGTEALRIDSSQRIVIGATSQRTVWGGQQKVSIEGTDGPSSSAHIVRNSNDASYPYLALGKSRGTSDGSSTIVQDDDVTGIISFNGADGGDMNPQTAYIESAVDGTPGTNDMPGRLAFYTTPDGAYNSTERLRITSAGKVGINETAPDRHLHVKSGANNNDGALRIESSTDNIMDMGTDGTGHFLNCVNADPFRVKFAGTERLRINSSGRVFVGNATNNGNNNAFFKVHAADGDSDDLYVTQLINSEATAGRNYGLNIQAGSNSTDHGFRVKNHAGTVQLLVKGDGHVMINTTTEGFATYGDQFTIANSGHCGMTIRSGTSNDGNIYFSDGTSGSDEVRGFVEYNHSSNFMQLGTDGAAKIRITSAGNVGIGELSPDNKLHVTTTTDTEQIKVENTASSGRAQVKFVSPHATWVAGTLGGSTTGDFITYTAAAKNNRWYTNNIERLRLTSGGQLIQYTTHTTGASAHEKTSWYGDDANHYNIEIRDFNEMYAAKTVNTNEYTSLIYKRETMTDNCDIEFTLTGQHDSSGSGYYHLGMLINSDGSDTSGNFDRMVFRANGGNANLNSIRTDKWNGGHGFYKESSSFPQFFDGSERHILIQIRKRQVVIHIDGVVKINEFINQDWKRSHGFFGFGIYEQSAYNPWIKVRNFKIKNYTPEAVTGPGWSTLLNMQSSSNSDNEFEVTNMGNPSAVEIRFWRLRHSGGNANTYLKLKHTGGYASGSIYSDIGQYQTHSSTAATMARGYLQSVGWCPMHWDFTSSTNYYSGFIRINRISNPGVNHKFTYESSLTVDYDSGNTQYWIRCNGRMDMGSANDWDGLSLYTSSGTNFVYGDVSILAQY